MGVSLKDLEGVSKKSINPHAPPKKVEVNTIIFQEARKLSNMTEGKKKKKKKKQRNTINILGNCGRLFQMNSAVGGCSGGIA